MSLKSFCSASFSVHGDIAIGLSISNRGDARAVFTIDTGLPDIVKDEVLTQPEDYNRIFWITRNNGRPVRIPYTRSAAGLMTSDCTLR